MKNFEYPDGATPLDPEEMEGLKLWHITTRGELDRWEFGKVWKRAPFPNDHGYPSDRRV
jgi:hypothetical protein